MFLKKFENISKYKKNLNFTKEKCKLNKNVDNTKAEILKTFSGNGEETFKKS